MDSLEHSELIHYERQQMLCRLCGERREKKKDKGKSYECLKYKEWISSVCSIDVTKETNLKLFPQRFCLRCYSKLNNLRKSENLPFLNSLSEKVEATNELWIPYDARKTTTDCKVCHTIIKHAFCFSNMKPTCQTETVKTPEVPE